MMMPANYSAIAENEMTYVVGGESFFPAFNQLSTLFTNVVNIIGNTFVPKFVDATIGQLFGGSYKFGNVWNNGISAPLTKAYDSVGKGFNGVLNAGLQVVGGLAAVAQLMNNDVKVYTKETVVGIDGKVVK